MTAPIWLVRHGETEWSLQRRHTGRTDIPLTSEGERRALALADFFAAVPSIGHALVFSSPLERARRTCELAGLGADAELLDDLMEWDYGEFEGTRTSDLREADPTWSIWERPVRDGEDLADVGARADRAIGHISGALERTGAPLAVVFAHAHLLRILAVRWCGWEPGAGEHLTLLPASVSILGRERETKVIVGWNAAAGALPV